MRPGKTTHIFQFGEYSIKFSGNFDSGNLRNVLQIAPFQYQIEPALDSYIIQVSNKAFFHFSVQGFPQGSKLKLLFKNLSLLNCLKQDSKRYRPFYSEDGTNYMRLKSEEIQIFENSNGFNMRLTVLIKPSKIFFSFALPYSYERYLNMIRDLPQTNQEIYINKEVLCYSNNLNLVYMITITSNSKFIQEQEKICQQTNGIILPEKHLRPVKRYCDKPVILISSRVHPGETTSSWAVQGIIHFLLNNHQQAKLLRKHFQIVIVPMLNPDGVEQGNYRLDTKGHNLNRYYLISDNRQPSIYCMKHLIRHFQQTKRLLYYFDFHGHPSQKGSFVYGNAIDELPFQVQTQLFARILSIQCPTFQQKFCIFDRQQMNSKDKLDMYTKQGCARVFTFKLSKIIHSYTIQLGFHGLSEKKSNFYYQAKDYIKQGLAILSSILISCNLKKDEKCVLPILRKQLAIDICSRQDRFRKQQKNLSKKKMNVNEIVQEQYWKEIYEHHFSQIMHSKKLKQNSPKSKFRLTKRQNYGLNLKKYFSQQICQEIMKNNTGRQDATSIEDLLEEQNNRNEANVVFIKLNKNQNSFKSTNISSKHQTQQKKWTERNTLQSKKFMLTINLIRQKSKYKKRPGILKSIEQRNPNEQQYLFSDLNIRDARGTEGFRKKYGGISTAKRNKIHSLFIQSHV